MLDAVIAADPRAFGERPAEREQMFLGRLRRAGSVLIRSESLAFGSGYRCVARLDVECLAGVEDVDLGGGCEACGGVVGPLRNQATLDPDRPADSGAVG